MTENVYQTFTLTVPAGASQTVVVDGYYIACLSADARFSVSIDDGPSGVFEKGMSLAWAMPFHKVKITNTGAVQNVIELGISSGQIRDARLNLSGSINNEAQRPDLFTDAAPVAAAAGPATTLLLAANTKRAEALLVNTGTVDLWIKGGAGVAKTGLFLVAGQSLTLTTTATIYAYNPDAATAGEVAVAELEFS